MLPESNEIQSSASKRELLCQQWQLCLLAISFFTRIPVNMAVDVTAKMLNEASRYFALVGVLIGIISALAFYLSAMYLPTEIALLVAMASSVLLTGAFHEDGWADVWDGFGGGWSIENKLNISLIADTPYVSEDATSKVKPLAQALSNNSYLTLLATGTLILLITLSFSVIWKLVVILLLTRWCLKRWFMQQLGGYTGDCLGAAQQFSEVVIYISLLALTSASI